MSAATGRLAALATSGTAALPDRAAIDVKRLASLVAQLAVLLVIFKGFNIESDRFFTLAICAFAGFVIHYFTPFRWKKPCFIAISLVTGYIVLAQSTGTAWPLNAILPASAVALVVILGLFFFFILRLSIPYWSRIAAILAVAGVLAWMRITNFLPEPYFLVIGAIFMFRLILYAYEVKSARKPERLDDYASYFTLLPNFYFVLFPVVDYSTFKKSFYAGNIHDVAQRGIAWMLRGTTHLLLYRVIYHNLVIGPEDVHSPLTLIQYVLLPFWLYLNVSGQFHIIVGMLHLFGYMLPETNRKYYLASSFTDLWRRINIYWKDFMVKVFYYPVYFRLRKRNETLALVVATAVVFVATTLLHGYQMFWLHGAHGMTSSDYVFWGILGGLVLVNVLMEAKAGRSAKPSVSGSLIRRIISTLVVYLTMTVLWSLWTAQGVGRWIEAITYWR